MLRIELPLVEADSSRHSVRIESGEGGASSS
jgi:hypothetical protein